MRYESKWISEQEFVSLFGVLPTKFGDSMIFEIVREVLTLKIELCQAERFARILVYLTSSDRPIISLILPRYGYIGISRSSDHASLTFGPPMSDVEALRSAAPIIAPVKLTIHPEIQIELLPL